MDLGEIIARSLFMAHGALAMGLSDPRLALASPTASAVGKASEELLAYFGITIGEGPAVVTQFATIVGIAYAPIIGALLSHRQPKAEKPSHVGPIGSVPAHPGGFGGVPVTPGGITLAP